MNLRIPLDLLERVDAYAWDRYMSRNDVIVQAVLDYLNRKAPGEADPQ